MRQRFYVTGTDTEVGKTLVTGGLARALVMQTGAATVVKVVQTGLAAEEAGDAQIAAAAAGCRFEELVRFAKAADAWSAARAAGAPPPRAPELAARIERIVGAVVVEGSGGAAVPLNENETISDVALACKLEALIVVGLRLGCINHALLTREFLERRGIPVRGALLCECRPDVPVSYAAEVEAVLGVRMPVLGTIPFYATYAVRAEAAFAIARRFLRGRLPEVALLEVNE